MHFKIVQNSTALTAVSAPGVTEIGAGVFSGYDILKDVYYTGSGGDLEKIEIGVDNEPLVYATICFNSTRTIVGFVRGIDNNNFLHTHDAKWDTAGLSAAPSYRISDPYFQWLT